MSKSEKKTNLKKEETTLNTRVFSFDKHTAKIQMEKAKDQPSSLVLLMGPSEFIGFYWPIEQPVVVIGRSRRLADILIPHTSISKSHFQLVQKSDNIYIIDLNSTNHTYLDNKKLVPFRQQALKNNSQIRAGNVIFKFLSRGHIELFSTQHILNKAYIDSLTGAANRLALEKKGPEYFKEQESFCLILFDIDNFKYINDTYGHLSGDFVLRTVCEAVRSLIREGDMLFRYGGDEFCLFTPSIPKSAKKIAERIRKTIEKYSFVYEKQKIKVTISLGVASRFPEDKNWKNICDRADKAFYKAKKAGRNRVEADIG